MSFWVKSEETQPKLGFDAIKKRRWKRRRRDGERGVGHMVYLVVVTVIGFLNGVVHS